MRIKKNIIRILAGIIILELILPYFFAGVIAKN